MSLLVVEKVLHRSSGSGRHWVNYDLRLLLLIVSMHRLASYNRQHVYPFNELKKYYQAGPKFIALVDIFWTEIKFRLC